MHDIILAKVTIIGYKRLSKTSCQTNFFFFFFFFPNSSKSYIMHQFSKDTARPMAMPNEYRKTSTFCTMLSTWLMPSKIIPPQFSHLGTRQYHFFGILPSIQLLKHRSIRKYKFLYQAHLAHGSIRHFYSQNIYKYHAKKVMLTSNILLRGDDYSIALPP